MGKRKGKGRCARKNKNAQQEPDELISAPHSFVIHKGVPGGNIMSLTKDFRRVMEPFTASSLKERKKNTIKDFVHIAGPLHVSHLAVFSRSELGAYMKLAKLPRGPTLTFKIHNFSLSRDVISSLKKQVVLEDAFKYSPLIILNGFSGEGMQFKLMASMFQNMFPTINLAKVDLNTVRRCVLMNYNSATKLIDFRHYSIKVAPVGLSKGVKKMVQGKVPNLAKCEDISEFFSKAGLLSESEAEDDPISHVTLPQKIISRGNMEAGKSAVRLIELGPRLNLQLIKIEDGLMDGEVLYHELIHKSEEEKVEIEKRRALKKKLKEKRKKIQEDNTKQKDATKAELKEKSLKGMRGKSETDILLKKAARESNMEVGVADDDDAEYYREEVGEEPDKDLFGSGMKRPQKTFHSYSNKKPRLDDSADKSAGSSFDHSNKKFGNKFDGKSNDGFRGKSNDRFGGKSNDGFRGKSNDRFGGKSNDGFRGKSNDGFRGKSNDRFGGKSNDGFRGKSNDRFGGKSKDGFRGKSNDRFGGKSNDRFGGKSNDRFGGKSNDRFGGKSNDRFGGKSNDGYRGKSNDRFGGKSNDRFGGKSTGSKPGGKFGGSSNRSGKLGNKSNDGQSRAFRKSNTKKGMDKTNSRDRDFSRPIGGSGMKSGIRKYGKGDRKRN